MSDTKPVFDNVEEHDGWVSHPIKSNLREEWYKQELGKLSDEVVRRDFFFVSNFILHRLHVRLACSLTMLV